MLPPPADFWPFLLTLAVGACAGLLVGFAAGLAFGDASRRRRITVLENEIEDLEVALDLVGRPEDARAQPLEPTR